ncbi:unannotated protein [freshwater metagenome]|uniref:Unannotated protein n=1 Tax=freshwater metagenome TaxID=449393 RepID=A0A6J7FQ63_9ZZZZ|nr:hypothetical protein [Actinomycetota bacterium]
MTMCVSPRAVIATVLALALAAMTACGNESRGAGAIETSPVVTAAAPTSSSGTIPVTTTPVQSATTTTTILPVFDFVTPASADGWRVTNDTVMGGVSSGELAWSDGVLVFAGELSLDNNGGFASIRSPAIKPQVALGWAGRSGVRVQVDGDGRRWTLELRTDDDSGGWIRSFPTSSTGLTDVDLFWASFAPVTRFLQPRPTGEPLDPARIVTVAFYLVDGVEGSFRLGIRSIA